MGDRNLRCGRRLLVNDGHHRAPVVAASPRSGPPRNAFVQRCTPLLRSDLNVEGLAVAVVGLAGNDESVRAEVVVLTLADAELHAARRADRHPRQPYPWVPALYELARAVWQPDYRSHVNRVRW